MRNYDGGLRTEGGTSFLRILSSYLCTGLIMSGNYVEIMKGEFEKDEKYRWISGTGKSSLSEPADSLQ